MYGRRERLDEIDRRPAGARGDAAHAAAVAEQDRELAAEAGGEEAA